MHKNKAQHNRRAHTRFMRYLRIPLPQTKITCFNISISTYTNDKPHITFENSLKVKTSSLIVVSLKHTNTRRTLMDEP